MIGGVGLGAVEIRTSVGPSNAVQCLAIGGSYRSGDGRARQSCLLNKGVDLADRLAGGASATLTGRIPLLRLVPTANVLETRAPR
jgi:hypothetical protein